MDDMTLKMTINLNDVSKIKKFCNEVMKFESDIDLVKGRYVIDAKSTIGVFTLDLSLPVDVVLHSNDMEEIKLFTDSMKEFQ